MTVREAIQMIAKDGREVMGILCRVLDYDAAMCTCQPVDGSAIIEGVRLQVEESAGIYCIPKIGSPVIVQMINDTEGYVAMFSDIEYIGLLDDSYGGLVKVGDLVAKLNVLESDLNTLKQAFTAWVVVANDGGAALKAASAAWAGQTITETQVADLENDKIKHGTV